MRHSDLNAFSVLFSIVKVFASGPTMRPCKQDDYHFQYTECDNDNHRWKVAIPNSTCTGNVPEPVQATDCNFSCKEGTYLDLKSQSCKECLSGSYSLGGGYIFEDFVSVPNEFSVTTERIDNQYYTESNGMFVDSSDINCDKSGWMAVNGYLMYVPSLCLSTLSYSVHLVRPGNVTFTYLYSDGDVSFAFSVQNAQCIVDNDRQSYLSYTTEGKWKTKSVALNKGQTLLTWKGWAVNGESQPLLIKKIEIIGVAYAQQCTPCPNGTYSSDNSKSCTPCLPGSYSSKGASKCSDCDEKTTYSGFRAPSCVKRPPCTENDFVKVNSPCNEHGQATVSYKWVEPRTCSEDLPRAVKMSKDITTVACSPCNPGMEMVKSVCQFCQKNTFSDGKSSCQKCPSNTSPNYGYQVSSWFALPDVLQAECRQMEDYAQDCKNVTSWVLAGDHFHTAYVRRHDIYFTLTLSVDGFENIFLQSEPSDINPIGSISFTFETKCAGPNCAFYFFRTDEPSTNGLADLDLIAQWNGTVKKQTFSHPITKKQRVQYMWMFVRDQMSRRRFDDEIWLKDQASIFTINVTNVKNNGASACIPCPVNDKKECAPCPPGHYVNENDRKCILCPNGTYLNVTRSIGSESCVTCGPNLMSEKGVECDTNCQFNISGKAYDLSPLRGIYQAKGVQIFNRDMRYHHLFNVSICSKDKVTCSDSISLESGRFGPDYNSVSSQICRIIAVPQDTSTIFHGPLEIGDHIVGVSDVLKFPDFEVPRNIVAHWRYSELYFLYRSTTGRTSNCPKGRSTLLVFRCDPGQNKTHVDLPVACPDGTCDGCFFQIIITSRIACPLCTKSDYSEVIGECNLGKQIVHYIPTKLCVLAGEDQLKTKTRKCEILTFEIEVIIGVALLVALFLLFLVFYVWKKNQKLEYKYMKLVESSSGKDGELPAAESCGLHDDDDDDETSDRVVFAKGGKKTGWFSGRTNKMKDKGHGSENSALTLGGEIDDS